jgi:GDP-4-dehydro-6-deoxy-D-mannose reductase
MAAVLVTGALGFAGGHLIDLLSNAGATVSGWHRPGVIPRRHLPNVTWRAVDILDRDRVLEAVSASRPEVIYHCAGAAHVAQSWSATRDTLATNVLGTHHVLEAARKAVPAARILIPGSSYVYRQADRPLREDDPVGPESPYALSKLAQEMLGCRAHADDDLQVYITRSFNHIGPGQQGAYAAASFARQIATIEAGRAAPTILVGNLEAVRDLTDVRDTVRAYRAIVEKGRAGAIYNVCSGRGVKMRDVLDTLVALSRVPVEIRVDPSRYRPADNPILLGDCTRVRTETGWAPQIPLNQTLSDLLDSCRKEDPSTPISS